MIIKKNKIFNKCTFSINVICNNIKIIKSIKSLKKNILKYKLNKKNVIVIGDCTNSIFIENYNGFILLNRILGIKKYIYKKKSILHVYAGEKWHNLVKFSIKNKIYGLENLSFIPGRVGSSPVNNIGSYGMEIGNICKYVYIMNIENLKIIKLNNKQCLFNYRNSIFKNKKYNKYIILSIILELNNKWFPNINHEIFNKLNINIISPKLIYKKIFLERNIKIPSFSIISNSGSFFKNIIVNYNYIIKNTNINNNFYCELNNKKYKIFIGKIIEKSIINKININNISLYDKNKLILLNKGINNIQSLLLIIRILRKIINIKFKLKLINEVLLIKN